jgi:hypothetical protein
MQITDKQLDKFIQIYRKHFGILLDRESALVKGQKLAEVMKLILKDNYHVNHRLQ